MGRKRATKNAALPIDILRRLHEDAAEHLEIMHTLVQAEEKAAEPLKRQLDVMLEEQWHAYLYVTHLIALHDDTLDLAFKKCGMDLRQDTAAPTPVTEERQLFFALAVLPFLLFSLAEQHRFLWRHHGWRRDEISHYTSVAIQTVKNHVAVLTTAVHTIITQ